MRSLLVLLLLSCAAGKPPPPPAADPPTPAATAEDASCQSDAECALTYFVAGDCCPKLCAPRVVTVRRAMELKEQSAGCDRACPRLACMPPRQRTVPVCVENRCVGKPVKAADD